MEEKDLKSKIKDESIKLQIKTKETIEQLTIEQVNELLLQKWIMPIYDGIKNLSDQILDELIVKIELLTEKYAVTYADINKDLANAEKTLYGLIDELEGSEFDMKGLSELQELIKGE